MNIKWILLELCFVISLKLWDQFYFTYILASLYSYQKSNWFLKWSKEQWLNHSKVQREVQDFLPFWNASYWSSITKLILKKWPRIFKCCCAFAVILTILHSCTCHSVSPWAHSGVLCQQSDSVCSSLQAGHCGSGRENNSKNCTIVCEILDSRV